MHAAWLKVSRFAVCQPSGVVASGRTARHIHFASQWSSRWCLKIAAVLRLRRNTTAFQPCLLPARAALSCMTCHSNPHTCIYMLLPTQKLHVMAVRVRSATDAASSCTPVAASEPGTAAALERAGGCPLALNACGYSPGLWLVN